jgi:phenylacetate-coenzyme A ligase PaaK-like adenylate-forming protein
MDHSYKPITLLLDEVEPGNNYELVLTNFHGGAMTRYRIGDMIRVVSLRNEKLGIETPQMVFERRADDLVDFGVVRLTEKVIWRAVENLGIAYEDWMSFKKPGESTLCVLIEPREDNHHSESDLAQLFQRCILEAYEGNNRISGVLDDLTDMFGFKVEVTLLPRGTFANYMAIKQAEGADLAHIKPPHINPPQRILSLLLSETEEIIEVSKTSGKTAAEATTKEEEIAV